VLWHPDLQDVFTDLMDPDGDEVVLVDASFFCPPGESRNFAQIAEHAQQYGAHSQASLRSQFITTW
jgi:hypothetical protein